MTGVAGLDVGGTKTHGVLLDEDGHVRGEVMLPTATGFDGLLRTIEAAVDRLQARVGGTRVSSLGIGMPGLVDAGRGLVRHAGNLGIDARWFPISARLGEQFGMPVAVENDVNAAALGAAAAIGSDDLVFLSIGTGLAAGVIIGGTLRRGVTGAAGEVGHISVDPDGRRCHCGQVGCLETIASGRALAAAWTRSSATPAARAVLTAAQAGDERAIELWCEFVDAVCKAITVLCCTVDPADVLIGGGVAELGHDLVEALVAHLRSQSADSPFLRSMNLAGRVRLTPADRPVAAIGAALVGRR